jgi:hypothetical protein
VKAQTDKIFEDTLNEALKTVDNGSIQYRFDNGYHSALLITEVFEELSEDKTK